ANTKTNFRVAVVSSEDALAGRSKWVQTVDESNQVDQAELLATIFSDDKMATSDQANKQVIQLPAADFDYAYQSATKTTSFQSVSELKLIHQDPRDLELQPYTDNNQNKLTKPFRYTEEDYYQPSFLAKEQAVTPTAIGSAAHLLMQKVNLRAK